MVWQHIKKETGLGILRIQPFRQQYKRPAPYLQIDTVTKLPASIEERPAPYLQIDTARVFYMGNRQPSNFFTRPL